MVVVNIWIGGTERPESWYYTKDLTGEDFIDGIKNFIIGGAEVFYVSIDLEHIYLLDALKESKIQLEFPFIFHIHGAPSTELEEVIEKIERMDCTYGRFILL